MEPPYGLSPADTDHLIARLAELLDRYLDHGGLDEICSLIDEWSATFDRAFPPDEDEPSGAELKLNLLWFVFLDVRERCVRVRAGLESDGDARQILAQWLPYLHKGQDAWAQLITTQGWPFAED